MVVLTLAQTMTNIIHLVSLLTMMIIFFVTPLLQEKKDVAMLPQMN